MHYKMQSGTGALFIIGDCLRRPFLIRLRRLRPTMSSVLSEDELAWRWAALLVAVIGVPISCKPQSSSVRSDVVSSPWRRQSSASPAVPISGYCWVFLYLRRYFMTKDCQNNVTAEPGNVSDFCCGVLCNLSYLQEWILIVYRHVCLVLMKWTAFSVVVGVSDPSKPVCICASIRSTSSQFTPSSTHAARLIGIKRSSVNAWSNRWWVLTQRRIWNKSRWSCLLRELPRSLCCSDVFRQLLVKAVFVSWIATRWCMM